MYTHTITIHLLKLNSNLFKIANSKTVKISVTVDATCKNCTNQIKGKVGSLLIVTEK